LLDFAELVSFSRMVILNMARTKKGRKTMRRLLSCVALLMIGFTTVACTDNPPIPCLENLDFICDQAEQIPPVGVDDSVCNMAVTLEEACQELIDNLPPPAQEHIPVCDNIPVEDTGTCQAPGIEGDPCAEDADCLGVCEGLAPPEIVEGTCSP
jgi:hypothetical protein